MALKDLLGLYMATNSKGSPKPKCLLSKILEEFLWSGVDLIKHMQIGGYMKNSWIMYDHMKHYKDSTT